MKTLKQVLEAKAEKPQPLVPVEPDSTTALVPRTKDEKRFYDKHVVQTKADANGNGDDVFKGANVKAYNRSASNHGYNTKEDQNVYESKTLVQILGEKHLTPAEMKKREEVAKAIHRENPNMPMAKKMAIATATAKKVTEEVDLDQLDEAARHDQYMTYHAGVKDMLKKIGAHVDAHKEAAMSPTEWNKEKGGNMNMSHVYAMKGLHRTLQDMHDNMQQDVEYAQPPKAMKMAKEEVSLFESFAEDLQPQLTELFNSLNEENQQVMIEMVEAEDYDTVVAILKEVQDGSR